MPFDFHNQTTCFHCHTDMTGRVCANFVPLFGDDRPGARIVLVCSPCLGAASDRDLAMQARRRALRGS